MKTNIGTKFIHVVMILTFIVTLIGATYAYFTATAKSEEIVSSSTFVGIIYEDDKTMQTEELIPSSKEVALASYNNASPNGQCIDSNNFHVCSIYHFEVFNEGNIDQDMIANVTVNLNEMQNLKYMIFDVTDENNKKEIYSSSFKSTTEEEPYYTTNIFGTEVNSNQRIPQATWKKYEIVLWLNETGGIQNDEQGGRFAGTVIVSVTDATRVEGIIEALENENKNLNQ